MIDMPMPICLCLFCCFAAGYIRLLVKPVEWILILKIQDAGQGNLTLEKLNKKYKKII